jgi:hypothetical protein
MEENQLKKDKERFSLGVGLCDFFFYPLAHPDRVAWASVKIA